MIGLKCVRQVIRERETILFLFDLFGIGLFGSGLMRNGFYLGCWVFIPSILVGIEYK